MARAGRMPRGQNQVAIRLCAVGRAPSQAAHFALAQRGELGIGVENRRELAICRVDPNKRSGMRRRLARADNCLRDRLTSQQRIRRRENYRSEEHTSELQSLMRISYAVFCLKKKT